MVCIGMLGFYNLGSPKSLGSCTSMALVFLRSSSLLLSLRWSAGVRSRFFCFACMFVID